MTPAERDLAATGALLLAQGRRIDRLSRPLTLLAAAALLLAPLLPVAPMRGALIPLALVVVLGLGQAFYAVRAGFDAGLFAALGSDRPPATLARLDAALVRLRLMPEAKAGRTLEARLAGAARLLRRQAAVLLGQLLACLGAALA
ncbi:hypothetical protein [Plastoroseomonas arctica]|uniref:Uncharacterized protein n=1 Tax=Plastoroseomonas arctica TaxID=1509237 RepID=A0AAF1KP76_9PROT|nr:hypothetical protein [Plastoroseomonas arctica]MBR0655513.1 hypothetical protein [Plastoroseomonas arctica]